MKIWSLYSDDDGVVLFRNRAEAEATRKAWEEAGANGLAGPFDHIVRRVEWYGVPRKPKAARGEG